MMGIDWVEKQKHVPHTRRTVLVWGVRYVLGLPCGAPRFIGVSKFNPRPNGGAFDVEDCSNRLSLVIVSHWAEIEGPNQLQIGAG